MRLRAEWRGGLIALRFAVGIDVRTGGAARAPPVLATTPEVDPNLLA